jgi:hypothetical protein
MNLLRDLSLPRLWQRLAVRRRTVRPVYTVTVPASLTGAEVIELRRPVVVAESAPLPRAVNG